MQAQVHASPSGGALLEITDRGVVHTQIHIPESCAAALARGEREWNAQNLGDLGYDLTAPDDPDGVWWLRLHVGVVTIVAAIFDDVPRLFADALAGVAE